MGTFQLKRSQAVLTPREAMNIINSTKNFRDRCIIKCLYYGGMRVQEVDPEHLTVGDLDFERRVIHVRKSKFGRTRTIPFLDSNFMTDLRQFAMGRRLTDSVFDVKRRMIQIIVQKAAEAANITHPFSGATHVSPHLFRHYLPFRTMSSSRRALTKLGQFKGQRAKPRLSPNIVGCRLQTVQEREDSVAGSIPAGLCIRRGCPRKCFLFHGECRLEVNLCGFHAFVTEPQRDYRAVDACL